MHPHEQLAVTQPTQGTGLALPVGSANQIRPMGTTEPPPNVAHRPLWSWDGV